FTPIEDIPELVKGAFISAEDKRFYQHAGYDPLGIIKAVIDAARGGRLRGASTITQQVMKNFLLGGERSIERKIKEIILASRIERVMSKDKILEIYLNEIALGQNSFGVTAAAQTYFNKTLEELLPEEAAYLGALPKAPSTYHPVRQRERAIARRNFVLKEMFQNGYISRSEYERAVAAPLRSVQGGDYPSFRAKMPPRDYFTDEIRRQLSRDFGEEEFFGGGLAIRATVDPVLQKKAAEVLRAGLEKYDRKKGVWRGAVASIDPARLSDEAAWREALSQVKMPRDIDEWRPAVVLAADRKRAVVGIEGVAGTGTIPASDVKWAHPLGSDGKPRKAARGPSDLVKPGDVVYVKAITKGDQIDHWSLRQIPEIEGAFVAMDVHTGRVLAMQGGFSYQHSVFNRATQATRQPGSAFKPFVYAAALDAGYAPNTVVIDAPISVETEEGIWRPKNSSNKFYGPAPLRTGIVYSRNLMTVRLAKDVGMDIIAGYAERFGVYDRLEPYLANALGSQETTLFRMVSAYAMFANGGERVEPTLVDRVQNRWGETIYRHDRRRCVDCADPDLPPGKLPHILSDRRRVIDAVTAYQLTSMMRGVVERGTAAKYIDLDVPVAGKTGTTNNSRDVWFIGFTSNIVAGCYMGFDQPRPLGRGAYGGSMCGPVFNEFMKTAVARYGAGPFKVPPEGVFVKIDRYTGERLPEDATGDNVVEELFRRGEEPLFGALSVIDGGFAMGSDLPTLEPGEEAAGTLVETPGGGSEDAGGGAAGAGTGADRPNASFGSVSSGGLY
ncbi:MAG: PBP1A family penicillin-binding protein, partial [Alphaproteobacteria bacterium]